MSYEEESVMATPNPSATPVVTPFKRRWSFGKLGSNKERAHKSSRSLDSMAATTLVKQAVLDLENQNRHENTRVLAMGVATASKRRRKPAYDVSLISKAVEDEAATRIQAAFRSYLAKRALYALRGLVKLQALVRGHLVRKQTTATLRRMHALMAIQVRARFQRIQMAEEPQFGVKSQPSKHGRFHHEKRLRRALRETENHGIIKTQNGFMNHPQMERIEQGITRYYYSGELKISKREQKYEEFSFTTHNSPIQSPPTPISRPTPGRYSFSSHEHPYPYMPNYMAKTESSKAKVRSQSEPKQRPTRNFKAKGQQRTASAEEMDDHVQQHCSSQSNGIADESQEPWFVKLYRSTRRTKENEGDDTSGPTSYSDYRKSLVTSEVSQEFTRLNLFF
ncbi:hypothetical protein PTKIN_Ptkin06aG0191400 [Pterospermum kingtungense]